MSDWEENDNEVQTRGFSNYQSKPKRDDFGGGEANPFKGGQGDGFGDDQNEEESGFGGRSRGGFGDGGNGMSRNRDGGNRGYGGGGNRNGGDGDRGFGGGGGGFRGGNRGRRNDDDGEANDDEDGGFGGGNRGGGRRDFGDRNGGGGRRDFGEGKREFGGGKREDREPDENGNFGDEKPREFYIPPEPSTDEAEIFNTGITSGINFSKYDKIPVKVTGDNPAPAITSFEEAGMRDLVMGNIAKSGYTVPTPIQKTAIPIISSGRDLMACAQTGSGKTAAFLLPMINKLLSDNDSMQVGKPHGLVVSPTRELAIQIFNEARKFSLGSFLKISIVYGGTSSKHQSEMVSRGSHILICTPGRLLDFVDRGYISFEETRFVVLDEADRMLDMGFKEAINKVMKHPTMRPMEERQTLMFSATFPSEIQRMAGEYLNNYIFITIGIVGGACSDVEQNIIEVQKFQKRNKLLELLGEKADGSIVFVETKRNADFLASVLSDTEFPTTSIHGDRLQSQRELALAEFKSGRMKVLIATSVAARGLDIRNVRHVINYDLPTNIDDYVHRIGRTGRVGNKGKATSFYDPEKDSALGGPLVKILQDAGQEIPEFLQLYVGASAGCFSDSGFGGRDVRGHDKGNGGYEGPSALEPEEAWD